MKQYVEVDGEGLDAFMGKRILLMSAGYFYEGKLVGINDTFVKLDDAHIVYDVGRWSDTEYKGCQKLSSDEWYVMKQSVESFGASKRS